MIAAARKRPDDVEPKIFDDVPVLQRKWQAAMRPGETYSARGQVQPFHQRPGGVAVAVA